MKKQKTRRYNFWDVGMNLSRIESQNDWEQMVSQLDWEDAFVKEVYIISPTYIEKNTGGIFGYNAKPDISISIFTPASKMYKGLELQLKRVDLFNCHFQQPIHLIGKVSKYNLSVKIRFSEHHNDIEAEECHYQFLTEENLGNQIRYGNTGEDS